MGIRLKISLLLAFLFLTAIVNSLFTFQLEGYGEEKLMKLKFEELAETIIFLIMGVLVMVASNA